jgi:hypothetical protein
MESKETIMRAISAMSIQSGSRVTCRLLVTLAVLAIWGLAPGAAAAAPIAYDFSATLAHGPIGDLGNTAVTGHFAIDFDTATITAFDFLMPGGGEVDSSHGYIPQIFTYTPAVNPPDNFVQLAFNSEGGPLWLLFRTTLGAFDGRTFYTGLVDVDGGGTGSGYDCRDFTCGALFGSLFTSGLATPASSEPPPPGVPEPTSLTLLASGVAALVVRRRPKRVGLTRSGHAAAH